MGKTRKKKAGQYEILLSGEFYGYVDSWTEYLCLARNPDGSVTLTSRSPEVLAESGRYKKRGWLPATIRRKKVWRYDGDYVVGNRLLHQDGDAEISVPQNQFQLAAAWLIRRKWDIQDDFGEAWAKIRSALYGPEFFSPSKPLSTLHGAAPEDETSPVACSAPAEGGTPSRPDERKPREIVIRCAGPSEPWIIWLEIVFLEWSVTSFSVYAGTGETAPGSGVSLGPRRIAARLSWREVLKFVQAHDLAAISDSDPQPIDIHGLPPWQRDIIAAGMMRLSTIVPLLVRLPENELQSLHERLGGFLSQDSINLVGHLAAITGGRLLGRKSLAGIAELVGSSDPLDVARLAEDCDAYLADRDAEKVLARYRDTPAAPPKLFLSLLDYKQPSPRFRAGLFELWLRAEPKPKGGRLWCQSMDDELPVLHWLLQEQAAEVFHGLVGTHRRELHEFVSWFLGKARPHAERFTEHSPVLYGYGRARYAAWAGLAKEVQDAATRLGIDVPSGVRLPAMPHL